MSKVLPFIGSQDPVLLLQQEDFPSIVVLLHIGQMDLETYKTAKEYMLQYPFSSFIRRNRGFVSLEISPIKGVSAGCTHVWTLRRRPRTSEKKSNSLDILFKSRNEESQQHLYDDLSMIDDCKSQDSLRLCVAAKHMEQHYRTYAGTQWQSQNSIKPRRIFFAIKKTKKKHGIKLIGWTVVDKISSSYLL